MAVHLWHRFHCDCIKFRYVMPLFLVLQPIGGGFLKPIAYNPTRMLQLFWILALVSLIKNC